MAEQPFVPTSACADGAGTPFVPLHGSVPVELLRPAAPTLRAALAYIRGQADAADARATLMAQEAGLLHELAAASHGHARHLEDLLFLMGEAA